MLSFFRSLFRSDAAFAPGRYRIHYRVNLSNPSAGIATGFLVLPVPGSDDAQHLISTVVAHPEHPARHREKRYKNEYVVWKVALAAGATSNFSLEWTADIIPIAITGADSFHLSDYPVHTEALHGGDHLAHQNPVIQAMAKETAGDEQNLVAILRKLQNRVQKELSYGNPIDGLYSAEEALSKRVVDCGGFDTLLVSLCRALHIPARVVSGFWAGQEKNTMHAWAEAQLPDGRWFPLDPSVEYLKKHGRSKKRGGFGTLGSDRIPLSKGSDVLLHLPDGSTHTADILQTPLLISADPIAMSYSFLTERL